MSALKEKYLIGHTSEEPLVEGTIVVNGELRIPLKLVRERQERVRRWLICLSSRHIGNTSDEFFEEAPSSYASI